MGVGPSVASQNCQLCFSIYVNRNLYFSVAGQVLQYVGMALVPAFIAVALWKNRSGDFIEVSILYRNAKL